MWDLGYSCRTSARLTTQLLTHNHRAIKDRVAPDLGIDKKSRRIKGTLIRSEDGKRILTASELQPINKALGMELLMSSMLTCMDAPERVTSWCVLGDRGDPKTYAQGGREDILASYAGFRIVAEVSAKREVSLEEFEDQANGGIEHAEKRNERDGVLPTYVLIVNSASIEQVREYPEDRTHRHVYNAARRDARAKGDLRLIPFWGPDFAELVSVLSAPTHPVGLGFDSATFAFALDQVYAHLTANEEFVKVGTTRTALLTALAGAPRPQPSGPSP